MRALRGAEGFIPRFNLGLAIGNVPDRVDQPGIEFGEAGELGIVLRIERARSEAEPRQAIGPFALAAIDISQIDQGCDRIVMIWSQPVLRDRQRTVEPAARLN